MISEFQAVNSSTILDEDGDSSDWIEIRNPSAEAISLEGWYLTDDATELTKWRFPAVTIVPNDELLVFASGKDRKDSSELHTNFRLAAGGEFLALVKPDGRSIAQDFGPQFPQQLEDQSYGLALARDTTVLIDEMAPVKAYVPADDSLGLEWTRLQFDDSDWVAGAGAVGFENLRPGFTQREEFDAPLGAEWTIDLPAQSSSSVQVAGGGLRMTIPTGQDTTFEDRGLAPLVYRDVPGGSPAEWEMITHIQKDAPRDRGGVGIVIYDAAIEKPAIVLEQTGGLTTFRLTAGSMGFGTWSQIHEGSFFLRIVRNETDKTWSAYAKLQETDDWAIVGTVTEGLGGAPVIRHPMPGLMARAPRGMMAARFLSVEFVVAGERMSYGQEIGLDVGNVMSAVNSSIYMRIPFRVQGDPARFDVLGVGARYDDGFKAYLNGVEITAPNAPIRSTWNSSAAGIYGAVNGRIPQQRIELTDPVSALREGNNVLAVHGMNVTADDSDFFFHVAMVASQLLPPQQRVFARPTPNAPNLLPRATAPAIKTQDGVFFGSTRVELDLQHITGTLEVRYTLDGTEPNRESSRYTGPITLTESAMFEARTFDTLPLPNFEPSQMATGTFLAINEDLRQRTSNMPLVIVDTLGLGLPESDENELRPANAALFAVDGARGRSAIDTRLVDYLGRIGARDRGKSTAGQPKPNMAIETWGPSGSTPDDDLDTSLLGLPADSDWILYAPYNIDQSLIRNALVYELSNQMGMWAPHTRFVEVYLNQRDGIVSENDYAGVYVLMEKIKQGPRRVNIAEIGPEDNQLPDISGGFIWKVDTPDPDAPTFTAGGQPMNWVYPKSPLSTTAYPAQRATLEQELWVQDYFQQFEATLASPDINDPNGYSKFVDLNSWVDQHILRTLMRDVDAFALSSYMVKDRGGKLVLGPAWDFDRTADSSQIGSDDNPYLLRTSFGSSRWFSRMFTDPGFWQLYVDRWQMWRQSVLSDQNIASVLSALAREVGESAQRNIARWSESAPRVASPFGSGALDGTYQGEVEHLRRWLEVRAKFLDSNYTGRPQLLVEGSLIDDVLGIKIPSGTEVQFQSAPIDFVEDAPLISGQPGVAEATYFVPSNDDLGDSWTQIDFDAAAWPRGPAGLGYGRAYAELVRTEVDPRPIRGATNILARFSFDVSNLAADDDRSLVLRMKYDDGFVAYLNGLQLTSQNFDTNVVRWNTGAVKRENREAAEFQDFDISGVKNLLVEGTNILAIRGVETGDGDMLVLPELVWRRVQVGRSGQAKVYYTVDGTDPRGPDGQPSPTAIEATADHRLPIVANTQVLARSLDPFPRRYEGEIVGTHWSSPVQYRFIVSSPPGDSNADGVFNQQDIQLVLAAGRYLTGFPATLAEGDWNGDGLFNQLDIVAALQANTYQQVPRGALRPYQVRP
jgi:hypothetical protein